MWGNVSSEVSPRSYVVSTPEGNFQRNRRHVNVEKESIETQNDGDRDKQNKDTINQENKKVEGTKTTEFHLHARRPLKQ